MIKLETRLGANPVPFKFLLALKNILKVLLILIRMKAIYWDEANKGMTFEEHEIPAEYARRMQEWRENMVEAAAEASEELMEKYLRDW